MYGFETVRGRIYLELGIDISYNTIKMTRKLRSWQHVAIKQRDKRAMSNGAGSKNCRKILEDTFEHNELN